MSYTINDLRSIKIGALDSVTYHNVLAKYQQTMGEQKTYKLFKKWVDRTAIEVYEGEIVNVKECFKII